MALTAKQEGFAQAIADGMSQSDAYRSSYNAGRMSDKQIWEEASKLIKSPKVAQRLDELREALAEKQLWTRADSVNALVSVIKSEGVKGSEVTGAVKELNAMHGFNEPAKSEVTHKGLTGIVLEAADEGEG